MEIISILAWLAVSIYLDLCRGNPPAPVTKMEMAQFLTIIGFCEFLQAMDDKGNINLDKVKVEGHVEHASITDDNMPRLVVEGHALWLPLPRNRWDVWCELMDKGWDRFVHESARWALGQACEIAKMAREYPTTPDPHRERGYYRGVGCHYVKTRSPLAIPLDLEKKRFKTKMNSASVDKDLEKMELQNTASVDKELSSERPKPGKIRHGD